jgi:peptidoglycan-associated lipoprotein
MKMNQLVFPLALALAAMLATTGCKHGPNKITPLPGPKQNNMFDQTPPPTMPPGPTIPAEQPPTFTDKGPGTTPTTDIGDISNYNQDRAALAAYTVHFKFDSAAVQDKEQANIASVAQALTSDVNAKLLIEGHCDERGTEEYNRSLGERRALALREALAKVNVSPDRIRTISYGKDRPADTGHDEAAYAKNRRGEFVLLHPK